MPRRILPFVLFSGALVLSACSEPVSPVVDPVAGPAFTRATTIPFTATTVLVQAVDPGDIVINGKVVHIREATNLWSETGDLEGWFLGWGDILQHLSTGAGPAHGGFTMGLTTPCEGTFEGNWHGTLVGPVFSGTLVGQGTEGCSGMTIKGDFTDEADPINNVVISTGTIHDSNAH
jgi:hypothetical protein